MKAITKEELAKKIELHQKWMNGEEEGGEQLILVGYDLRNSDLSYSSLSHSDLSGSNLNCSILRYSDLSYSSLSGSDLSGSDLSGCNLSDSNLSGSNLGHSDFRNSDLSGCDLSYSNLGRSNLSRSNLSRSNLSHSDFRNSDLSGSDLSGCDLSYSNLGRSNLSRSNLSGCNLGGSNLRGSDLRGCYFDENTSFFQLQCPEEGAFIAWKHCRGYIVKLLVTENAKRSSATSRKCRCSEAMVLEIQNLDGSASDLNEVHSDNCNDFVYRRGEIVCVEDFCEDRWKECAPGIHFFITREEAVQWGLS